MRSFPTIALGVGSAPQEEPSSPNADEMEGDVHWRPAGEGRKGEAGEEEGRQRIHGVAGEDALGQLPGRVRAAEDEVGALELLQALGAEGEGEAAGAEILAVQGDGLAAAVGRALAVSVSGSPLLDDGESLFFDLLHQVSGVGGELA